MKSQSYKIALKRLKSAGFEAYLVGGAVRDYYLHLMPHDFDITTNAKPLEILAIFNDCKTLDIGIKHGTVTVFINDVPLEITTYRIEQGYSDARHPDQVVFISNIEEDTKRRDFTINALLMNEEHEIIDLVGGINDLNSHLVRAIGEPAKRFNEDALRIMRGIRIANQYGFEIEERTKQAMFEHAKLLTHISKERIAEEFIKIVKCVKPENLMTYQAILKPLLNYQCEYSQLIQTDHLLIRLALLFKDHPLEIKKLFLNKNERLIIEDLITYQNPFNQMTLAFSSVSDIDLYLEFLQILYQKDFTQVYNDLKPYIVDKHTLAIKNSELIAFNLSGSKISQTKQMLVEAILNQEIPNEHEAILNHLRNHLKNAL